MQSFETLGIVAASLVAAGTIWRYVLVGGWRFIRRLARIHQTIEDVLPLVIAEFRPNGGTSLRDRVDDLARRQVDLEQYLHQRIHDILNEVAGVRARIDVRDK